MTTPTTCEPTEELRARARQAYQQWQQGDIIARSGLPSSILDFIAQHAAQESSRANERAEGLAKELEALRADREQWIIGFSAAFAREWMSDEQALLDEALRDLQHAKARGDCELAKKRKVSSLLGQACRARDAATARVAEMQDRMIAAFGEGTTADQLVAISHEHEARVAELETTLAHVERSGGIEQCLAREARIAELEKQLADKLEAVTASARVEKAEARADAAEAELARLRALPDGLRAEDGSPWRSPNVGMQVDELLAAAMHRLASGPFQALRTDLSIAATRIGVYLAAPLPSAQQVGAAPVDISLGECSAWTAPAQPAGHNPEGEEARMLAAARQLAEECLSRKEEVRSGWVHLGRDIAAIGSRLAAILDPAEGPPAPAPQATAVQPPPLEGSWPMGCVQRAFVLGAKWWQFEANGATAFPSEVDQMEAEAVRRYGEPIDPRKAERPDWHPFESPAPAPAAPHEGEK